MKRWLLSPIGWLSLVLLETGVLLVVARVLMRIFPNGGTTIGWVIIGLAVVAMICNYVLRRRLQAED